MYIIENGKAYLVDGEVGYLANFDKTGKMIINKKETIEADGKFKYTYDELYAKLNIAYLMEEAKRKDALKNIESDEIKKLNAEIEALKKENEDLKSLIEELENADNKEPEKEDKKSAEDEQPKVEDKSEKEEEKEENKKENK